jgi:hypothetical protein
MLERVITDDVDYLWLPIPFAFSDLIPYTVLEVFTRKESPMAYEMPYGVRWPADLIERIRAEAKANERTRDRTSGAAVACGAGRLHTRNDGLKPSPRPWRDRGQLGLD